ncbi:N-acetylneuraminate lyase-like, partial [Saccoglossus kowalevskii]|uniref:N-acetylneuraminate lyase n=1 Tax=Saccoglossus kowalevskii TaxID=10224 RepID=A0ABM0MB41_SACKO
LDVIILQVGTGSLNTTQELARHAEEKGVDAIAAIPTVPLLPNSIDDVVEYLKRVGDAAPKTPLFYYHFPKLTNVTFSGVTLLDAIQDKVPTFHGMKFTSNDLYDFARCMDHPTGGKYQVFSSYDQLLLPSLALGGEAFVGCHYNFIGRHGNRILEAYKNGDMKTAQKLQYQTNKLANLMDKYGHPGISKYLLTMVGFDFGPPRYPSQIMNEDQITELRKELDAIGFSDMQK